MATTEDKNPRIRGAARVVLRIAAALTVVGLTTGSAILTKELSTPAQPMAAIETVRTDAAEPVPPKILAAPEAPVAMVDEPEEEDPAAGLDAETIRLASDPRTRWFNGRPIKPARQYWMTVTGYSPDARSCGDSADGLTATLHSVQTNNMKLVAADTRILPYGSMISVPGYDAGDVVPVLDCGGAIKGRKLDLLFPTHEEARAWGKKRLLITVWEYADGKPAENPRKAR